MAQRTERRGYGQRVVDHRAVVVAARAAGLAAAAGVELPEDLALWRLAGGRPVVDPLEGTPEDLGRVLEANLDARQRQRDGMHFTPESLAAEVARRALAGHDRPVVCDPACGGGALLLAAARHQVAAGGSPAEVVGRLWGIDTDPVAVATTEAALALWSGVAPPSGQLLVADVLHDDPDLPPIDVVVGNPPFLSQLDATTARGRRGAARLRERFGAAVQAYTDAAGLFLLVGCRLVRSGGTVAMIQPQSVLAARDSSGVRAALGGLASLREVWVPEGRPFRAAVEVCVPVLDVGVDVGVDAGVGTGSGRSWASHLARAQGVPPVVLPEGPTVAGEATTTAAFRAEYYGLVPHVHEAFDRPEGRHLLTTGLVELGRAAWGERPARIGGRRWERPVVDVASLEGRAALWAERTAGPKVLVATQTRVVEAVVDRDGCFLPAVPLVVVLAPPERLGPLAAALCSPPVTAWVAQQTAGTALSAGALKLSAGLVRQVPLPPDGDAWHAGTLAWEAADLERFAEVMTAAYGCGPAVATWWLDRLGSAWSPARSAR